MQFDEYVAARRARLVRTAVLLGCPQADAEDVVQTARLRCYRSWRRVERAAYPDAYVKVPCSVPGTARPPYRRLTGASSTATRA